MPSREASPEARSAEGFTRPSTNEARQLVPIGFPAQVIRIGRRRGEPSGKFYLVKAGEASDRTRLFDRSSNHEVSMPDSTSLGVATGWVFSEGDFLLLLRLERVDPRSTSLPKAIDKFVFDVRSRRAKQRIDGEIQSWAASPGFLPVVRGGRVTVLSAPMR